MKNLKLVFYLTMFLVVLFSISIVNAAKDEYPTLNTPVKVDISGALPEFNRYELEQIIDSWVDEKFSESEAQKIKSEILNEDGIDAIMELQDNYKISPIFTLAVATTESYDRGSVNTSIFKEGKNLFNIIGEYNSNYVVYANKHYKKYDTYRESFFDFGRTIAESPYYFNANKTTIKQRGEVYYGNEKWTESVVKNSKEILSYFKERIYKVLGTLTSTVMVSSVEISLSTYISNIFGF